MCHGPCNCCLLGLLINQSTINHHFSRENSWVCVYYIIHKITRRGSRIHFLSLLGKLLIFTIKISDICNICIKVVRYQGYIKLRKIKQIDKKHWDWIFVMLFSCLAIFYPQRNKEHKRLFRHYNMISYGWIIMVGWAGKKISDLIYCWYFCCFGFFRISYQTFPRGVFSYITVINQ